MPGVTLNALNSQDEMFVRDVSVEYLRPIFRQDSGFLWDSGAVVETDMATDLANSSSETGKIRHIGEGTFWNDSTEVDCPVACGPCDSLEIIESTAVRQIRHKCFEQDECIRLFSADDDADLLGLAASRRADYWKVQYEKTAVAMLMGIMNDNIANDGADMVADLVNTPLDGTNTQLTARGLADAYAKTAPTVYRENPGFDVALIHPNKVHDLRMQNFTPVCCGPQNGQQMNRLPALLGPNGELVVIAHERIKDMLVSGNIYNTILLRRGSIGYGDGSRPHLRSENMEFKSIRVTEERCSGRVVDMFARYVVAPAGFSWLGANQAGRTPSFAEMADGTNWERTAPTNLLPFGFIQSN